MTESETPSEVFLKTSFTMRQRLTPDKACSTRTRIRPNSRFVRFSAAVNSPPAAFFFRLAGFPYRWLLPLETTVLVQDSSRRISDALLVGVRLFCCPADVGAAQESDALAARPHHDKVLVAVDLLPPAVVRCLFFSVFWPLAAALGAVDDQPRCLAV